MFSRLNYIYNHNYTSTGDQGRDQGLFVAPLYFNRAGYVSSDALDSSDNRGGFWSSTVGNSPYAYNMYFGSTFIDPALNYGRHFSWAVRCIPCHRR